MKTYSLKSGSEAKAAATEARAEMAESLSLGSWSGGPITSPAELAGALVAKAKAEKVLKAFTSAAKAWVDENGPVTGEDGKTWGPSTHMQETKASLTLAQVINLLTDVGVPGVLAQRVIEALKRRGAGEQKEITRYGWTK